MKILIPVGCRSDEGLSAPVIKRLSEKHIKNTVLYLDPGSYIHSYNVTERCIHDGPRPDIALIFGDRIEMTAAAAACFNNNIPIAHVYAGVNNNIATLDDINRHIITAWSDIQFCESQESVYRVKAIMTAVGKSIKNAHNVGITHLDDLEVSEVMVPIVPYDLVLFNPVTYGQDLKQTIRDGMITIHQFTGRHMVFLMPNPDAGREHILDFLTTMKGTAKSINGDYTIRPVLDRSEFLGLLKNCHRFITNSSAAIYEAPYFLKERQIIQIGARNRHRDKGPFEIGASDKIVEDLIEWGELNV
jgi:UDP-N-acetylglucosamine 2-epimerase